MSTDQPEEEPFNGDGPVWDRARLYIPWLVFICCVVFFVPMFRPIFEKRQERGGLPLPAALLLLFDQIDEPWYYLPAIGLAVSFVIFNESVFHCLGQRVNGRRWCRGRSYTMLMAGMVVVICGLPYALIIPLTKMGKAVEASRKIKTAGSQQTVEVEQVFV